MQGGCHCGAVRYEIRGKAMTTSVCNCSDCRRHAGAPMVAWAMFRMEQFALTRGTPRLYVLSDYSRRFFCPDCGTGIFYENDLSLAGFIDVQIATLDDPDALPPHH